MKGFIVSVGIFILGFLVIVYEGDLGVYVNNQLALKEITEEMSSGAALYLDEEKLGEGRLVFDKRKGIKYIENFLKEAKNRTKFLKNCEIEYKVNFQDDEKGYLEENQKEIPCITVEVQAKSNIDIFKIPFVEAYEIKRTSRYELPYFEK